MEAVENAVIDALVKRAESIANLAQFSQLKYNPELQQLQAQLLSLKSIPGNNPAIADAIKEIETQIAQISYLLSQSQEASSVSHDLLLWAFSDPECWRNASVEDKQRVYRELVDKVLINNGRVLEVRLKI